MVKRFGLVALVLVLSLTSLGFRDKRQTVTADEPVAGPAIRPLQVVTSSVSRGLATLRPQRIGFNGGEERRAELRDTALGFLDVNGMARRALGQHWNSLRPREHEDFVRLFGHVLTQSFVTIVERHTGDSVASGDEEVTGAFAQVRFRTTPEQGSKTVIEYRLLQRGSQWTVYDIVLDGVSLVSSYRGQFNSIIGTSSVARLLERMRTAGSRRPESRDAVSGPTAAELEEATPGRLAAALLLGVAASPRGR
jgi:phospholipid transport system substrate-binding protein